MAKRKAARAASRKKTARKASVRRRNPSRASGLSRAKSRGKSSGKASARRARARKAVRSRKAVKPRKTASRKPSRPAGAARIASRTRSAGSGLPRASSRGKVPALNRERRTISDEDLVPTPPSSLDLDRHASAARTGRRELHEKFTQHTETSPAITGGDIDADWESAYTVGDEAPGGDNPTPDQDIVDDIGKALGVQYEDNEELKGEKKISDRDRKRWELDPASSDDYEDR